MNIPKWMRRFPNPPDPVSKIDMMHSGLCDAEDGVRDCIDAIENVNPTCLKGDEVKINTLSRRLDRLRETRDLLRDMKRAAIITELNKFPINTPCTLQVISSTIGIIDYEIGGALFRTSRHYTRKDVDDNYPEFKRPVYDDCISPDGTTSLVDGYSREGSYGGELWRVSKIEIKGWRFVESEYGHVYLERIS